MTSPPWLMAWINESERHLAKPTVYVDRGEIERVAADPKHKNRNWAKVLLALLDVTYVKAEQK